MFEFEEQLSKEEQEELLKNKENPQTKEKLIIHNLRLVNWVAKKYHKPDTPGRELEDLFQEGVLGLMAAVDNYDPNKGAFGAYAALNIKGYILRALTKQRVIRIPSHMVESINQYKAVKRSLEKTLERTPTQLEMSRELSISIDQVNKIESLLHDPISLNVIIGGEDDDITLEETIPDDSPTPDIVTEDKVFIEQIKEVIEPKLSELQYNSIILYYGLNGEEYTLKEIADKYKVTGEYIRAERQKALRKIRGLPFMQELYKNIYAKVEERTRYYRSIDYTQPRVTGGEHYSPVENIVLEREKIIKRLEDKEVRKLGGLTKW